MTKHETPQDKNYVTFEGKDYDIESLTEEQQYLVHQMKILQEEYLELQAALDRSKVGLEAFSTMFRNNLLAEQQSKEESEKGA